MSASLQCSNPGCDQIFRRREHLIRHERRHTNSRPFACEVCGRSFSRSDVLKRHIAHHASTSPLSRAVNACDRCHKRKTRCDGNQHCEPCRELELPCRRTRKEHSVFRPKKRPQPTSPMALGDTPGTGNKSGVDSHPAIVVSTGQNDNNIDSNNPCGSGTEIDSEVDGSGRRSQSIEAVDDAVFSFDTQPRIFHSDHVTNNDIICSPEDRVSPAASSQSQDLYHLRRTSYQESHFDVDIDADESRAHRTGLESNLSSESISDNGVSNLQGGTLNHQENCIYSAQKDWLLPQDVTTPADIADRVFQPVPMSKCQPMDGAPPEHVNDVEVISHVASTVFPLDTNYTPSVEPADLNLSTTRVGNRLPEDCISNPSANGQSPSSIPSAALELSTPVRGVFESGQYDMLAGHGFMATDSPGSAISREMLPHPDLDAVSGTILNDRMIQRYFSSFHSHWPILHKPTFEQQPCNSELRYSVAMIGALLEGDMELRAPIIRLHKWLLQTLLFKLIERHEGDLQRRNKHARLETLQAVFLSIVFAWYTGDKALLSKAYLVLGTLVLCIREAGYFRVEQIIAQDEQSATYFSRWLTREQKKRLVFAAFRLDCYLNLLHDHPPAIRLPELCLHYTCTEIAWNAATVHEWAAALTQEPPGRMDRTFTLTCIDALSEATRPNLTFLLPEDFESGMCAMQSRLWEEAQHKHEAQPNSMYQVAEDGQTTMAGVGYGLSWQVQLEIWRATMDHLADKNSGFSSENTEMWNHFTAMMLYHLSFLRMYADLPLVQRLIDSLGQEGYSPALIRRFEAQTQDWVRSTNAQRAVWHAAQILQLFTQNAPRIQADQSLVCPFTVTCLFRAAQVLWAACRSTLSCDLCQASSVDHDSIRHYQKNAKVVYDFMTLKNEADMSYWMKEFAKGSIGDILICACNMPALLDKFICAMDTCTVGWNSVSPLRNELLALKMHR